MAACISWTHPLASKELSLVGVHVVRHEGERRLPLHTSEHERRVGRDSAAHMLHPPTPDPPAAPAGAPHGPCQNASSNALCSESKLKLYTVHFA